METDSENPPQKTATHIKDLPTPEKQKLYRVNPPLEGHEYVVTNSSSAWKKVCILGSDENGKVKNWTQDISRPPGFLEDLDHELALRMAGYSVKDSE